MDGHVSETASFPGWGDFFHLSGRLLQVRARDLIRSPANILGCLTAKAECLTVFFIRDAGWATPDNLQCEFLLRGLRPPPYWQVHSSSRGCSWSVWIHKLIPACFESPLPLWGYATRTRWSAIVYLRDRDAYSNKHLVSITNSPSHKDGRTKRKV